MPDFSLLFYLLLAFGALSLLGYLANRFPWFGLLGGTGFLITAVHFWQRTSARDFRTDGSAAGAFLMVMFGLFEIVLVIIGVGLIGALSSVRAQGGAAELSAQLR